MQIDSAWGPLLWPARLAMPVGGLLLTLQGIPEIFRAFHKMGKERERLFVRVLPWAAQGPILPWWSDRYDGAALRTQLALVAGPDAGT